MAISAATAFDARMPSFGTSGSGTSHFPPRRQHKARFDGDLVCAWLGGRAFSFCIGNSFCRQGPYFVPFLRFYSFYHLQGFQHIRRGGDEPGVGAPFFTLRTKIRNHVEQIRNHFVPLFQSPCATVSVNSTLVA